MKEVKIKLDDKSIEILKEVEAIHRDSLINFSIRLLEQHPHYKIIKGEIEDLEKLNNIENIKDIPNSNIQEKVEEEPVVSFDDGW